MRQRPCDLLSVLHPAPAVTRLLAATRLLCTGMLVGLSMTACAAQSGIVVRFDPASSTGTTDALTTLDLRIDNASNLWGVGLKLTYDPRIVECVQSQVGTMPTPEIVARNSCASGTAEYIVSQKAPSAPAQGSGSMVRLTFKCLNAGTTPLHFESLKIVDRDGLSLPRDVVEGEILCPKKP